MPHPPLLCLLLLPCQFLLLTRADQERKLVFSVAEEAPIGTLIGNLQQSLTHDIYSLQTDADAKFMHFTDDSRGGMLQINESTGDITVKRRIDRESLCVQHHIRSCCSSSHGSNSNENAPTGCSLHTLVGYRDSSLMIDIYVLIIDINDHKPEWAVETLSLHIPEHTKIGKRFTLPSANDSDVALENSIVSYELKPVPNECKTSNNYAFSLDVNSSEYNSKKSHSLGLRVLTDLDRDDCDRYNFILMAIDAGAQTGSLTIEVNVIDINDNTPKFEEPNHVMDVPENIAIGSVIFQASATDADPSDEQKLQYSMGVAASAKVMKNFVVDARTGVVKTRNVLDFEDADLVQLPTPGQRQYQSYEPMTTASIPGYVLPLLVTDGKFTAQQNLYIKLINVNDNLPQINIKSQYFNDMGTELRVSENIESGGVLAIVEVSDPDENAPLFCNLKQKGDHFALKERQTLNRFTLAIQKTLDRETDPQMQLAVECRDNGEPIKFSLKKINIHLLDVNDCSPKFEKSFYFATVKEGLPVKSNITRVRAHDRDSEQYSRIRYRIVEELGISAAEEHAIFTVFEGLVSIDAESGEVSTNIVLDRETLSSINCTIEASDGRFSSTVLLVINIEDVNDCVPHFEEDNYLFSIKENSQSHQKVSYIIVL
ncbi:putative calcium-dependent cell-adhesion protein [Cichlidogyrus casuarinus]|uniref:Calcium-dependent cell-adhesion protein n=1 Tax=Cichlidogyrus casuarinus TaxID=1844966 RepID=A0ABD2QHM2_9PLAT